MGIEWFKLFRDISAFCGVFAIGGLALTVIFDVTGFVQLAQLTREVWPWFMGVGLILYLIIPPEKR